MSCFQCDLDIAHVCYAGIPNARWGLHDGAIAALEAARHYLQRDLGAARDRREPLSAKPRNVIAMKTESLRVPDGWILDLVSKSWPHLVLLTAPPPLGMVTIDFRQRGFRGGCTVSGHFVGEKVTRRGITRPAYGGRGWRQKIVDDAVAWLEGTRVKRSRPS